MKTVRECSITDLDPRLRALLNQHMSPDEQILVCCEVTELATYQEAITLTDRRVISTHMKSQSGFNRVMDFVGRILMEPLEEVQRSHMILLRDAISIDAGQHPRRSVLDLPCYVTVKGRGSDKITFSFPAKNELYEKVFYLLRESVDRARQPIGRQETDAAGQLRQLAKLHSEGLLTDEEFQRKREELVDKL